MLKVKKVSIGLLIFSIVVLCLIFDRPIKSEASSDDENSRPYIQLNNTSSDPMVIYNQIEKAKQRNHYSFNSPLLIENPYGTNTTGIYMYFETDYQSNANYTISCEGYQDFTRTLNTSTLNGLTCKHEYLLVGSISGVKNTITVSLSDSQGTETESITWSYQAPSLLGGNEYLTVETETFDTTSSLTNGLYTVLGNDVSEDNDTLAYMRLYDNEGIIRSEIPIISYRSHRVLFNDKTMYFSVSSTKIVGIEQTGFISTIYDTGDYMINSTNFWQESGYDELLLSKTSDFSLQAGQHCVTYDTDSSLAVVNIIYISTTTRSPLVRLAVIIIGKKMIIIKTFLTMLKMAFLIIINI